jgi:hypothetical protein
MRFARRQFLRLAATAAVAPRAAVGNIRARLSDAAAADSIYAKTT